LVRRVGSASVLPAAVAVTREKTGCAQRDGAETDKGQQRPAGRGQEANPQDTRLCGLTAFCGREANSLDTGSRGPAASCACGRCGVRRREANSLDTGSHDPAASRA
jgi:hypothetical protein